MLDLLEKHRSQFSTYTELRLHNNYNTHLHMRKGMLMGNSTSVNGGVSARCYQQGAFGFSSAPGQQSENIERVIATAADNARFFQKSTELKEDDLPQTHVGSGEYNYRSQQLPFTAQQRVDILNFVNNYVQEKYSDLLNWDLALKQLDIEKGLVTSEGCATYSYIPRTNLLAKFSFQAPEGDIIESYTVMGGFGQMEDLFQDPEIYLPDIDSLYEEVKQKASGVFPKPGVHDVILDSKVAGILAHEAIGHTVEADFVLSGSVAKDYLNKQVASEKITMVDYKDRGPDSNASIAIHVDDEGTPCQDTVLIQDGILVNYLHSKDTARQMNMEPTGNARAFSFSDEPLVRMRNTCINPGTDKLDDMIAEIEDGYYLTEHSNGQADATSEFMFGITFGYEIKNGKLGRPLKDSTISGVAFDMLQSVTHVSDELTWSCGGMCGKKQLIPVGMGGPAIKCQVTIGGQN